MISPTVGRVVWVFDRRGSESGDQPEAALVTFVHDDTKINVGGFDKHGHHFAIQGLPLEQDAPLEGTHAAWMPFQKAQAAQAPKTDVPATITVDNSTSTT